MRLISCSVAGSGGTGMGSPRGPGTVPSAVPSATVETGMPSRLARCAAASGAPPPRRLAPRRGGQRVAALVPLAVGEKDHGGGRAPAVLAAPGLEAIERRVEGV